jgi:hypothetical protein
MSNDYALLRVEFLPDKGASMEKDLRDLRQKINTVEAELRTSQSKARAAFKPSMTKNPSASSLPGSKHTLLLNELPGNQFLIVNLISLLVL